MKELDYWMLARFPRWFVALVYTVAKIAVMVLLVAAAVVSVLLFHIAATAHRDLTIVCLAGVGILAIGAGLYHSTIKELPSRKHKEKERTP